MRMPIGNWFAALAIVGMVVPPATAEVATQTKAPGVVDVRLTAEGDFVGAIVGDDGAPSANRPVQVLYGSRVIAEVRTDANGRYSVEGLRSGLHVIKTVNNQQVCRFWSATSAPPAARRGLLMRSSDTIVRGQNCCDIGCGEDCEWNGCGEDCDGCGEGCGRCGRGCGLFGGGGCGLLGGAGMGAGSLVMVGAFAAVSAVTVNSATKDASAVAVVPASP